MESLNSTCYEKFEGCGAAIDGCLDSLSTVHKGEMGTLMTHKFQRHRPQPTSIGRIQVDNSQHQAMTS